MAWDFDLAALPGQIVREVPDPVDPPTTQLPAVAPEPPAPPAPEDVAALAGGLYAELAQIQQQAGQIRRSLHDLITDALRRLDALERA